MAVTVPRVHQAQQYPQARSVVVVVERFGMALWVLEKQAEAKDLVEAHRELLRGRYSGSTSRRGVVVDDEEEGEEGDVEEEEEHVVVVHQAVQWRSMTMMTSGLQPYPAGTWHKDGWVPSGLDKGSSPGAWKIERTC